MSRAKKTWKMSVGERGLGNRVRVYEARAGGPLWRSIFINGRENRKSLGHKDRKRALRQAHELSAQLLREEQAIEQEDLTLGLLKRLYLESPAHLAKRERTQKEDGQRLERVVAYWGPERRVETLTRSDSLRFEAARRRGDKELLGVVPGRVVRDRSVQADLVAAHTMLNWAARERDRHGRRLLRENPLRGVPIPREKNPVRPVATHDEYLKVLEVADQVHPLLRVALMVAEATGRRISAVRQLQWRDVDFEEGTILWPAATDKKGYQQAIPIPECLRLELLAARTRAGAIGGAWVLPSPKDKKKPCSRDLVKSWLERAYLLADQERQEGGLWHPFRRGWATQRKGHPVVDVAAAGGWRDLRTVQGVYQQADPETIRRVVLEPTHRLVSRHVKAG
jgi:integrase